MSKGSGRRPCLISQEQEELNWKLALGQITRKEYDMVIKKVDRKRKR